MPHNLLKEYNRLLEFIGNEQNRTQSLRGVFRRDIEDNNRFSFRGKRINPTKGEQEPMERLFKHLTTEVVNKETRQRDFERNRSERLHWIKHHVEERLPNAISVFSVREPEGIRTYIWDATENYVIVLESYRDQTEYYLLTAYFLDGRNPDKMNRKFQRRLPQTI